MKILFVCTGNTCRSPMAAALMNKIATENDIDIVADSAGVFTDGSPVSKNAIRAMREYEIDISSYVSKQVTEDMIENADLVFTMTEGQRVMITAEKNDKIFTLGEYSGSNEDIPDPFGGSQEEYNETADVLYEYVMDAFEKLVEDYNL